MKKEAARRVLRTVQTPPRPAPTPAKRDPGERRSGKLTDQQKAYVVRRLAEYDKPVAIAQGLQEIYGIAISHQAVEHYDPERPAGHDLAQQWRDVFWQARRAYIEDIAETGTTRKAVRMRMRERMMLEEWEAGNRKLANDILNSIAKESGNAFASKNATHDGTPLTATITISDPRDFAPAAQAADGVREPGD